ncbi:MAG: T9SS type A sorting domain-containing protein [candidate division Zixibacteria bacterium]|nr:T9SS type A sorting domain-containing protein [candidate division Zixibacteria bacterium]
MKTLYAIATILLIASGTLVAGEISISFDQSQLEINNGTPFVATYHDCQTVAIGGQNFLPARAFLLALNDSESAESIYSETVASLDLGIQIQNRTLSDDVTSDISRYDAVVLERNQAPKLGSNPVTVTGQIHVDGQRYAEILVFPVTVNENSELSFHPSIEIRIGDRAVNPNELLCRDDVYPASRREHLKSTTSGSVEYVVITSATLAEAMQSLVVYKNETGYVTELRLIEDILPGQTGRDDAEKLREYLKTFYAGGGRYVLLAGDETVLPIRYAYPNNTSVAPPMDGLQICDLYFADLTGEWDADNDGIWGEKYSDAPDIVPELLIGRLPINTSEEATNYIAKLIKYEINPGGNDRSYLERAFFFSSDQMRDYGDGGQHALIASAYPDWFQIDTSSAVEQANGSDPAPTNLIPYELTPILQNGFGIINVIAHGRSDGFVLKSSGYNNWPKTYMLTDAGSAGHGSFESYADPDRPAFYYSLACDNGGFDMDQPPINHVTPNMAQELIGNRGGAVGFVAYSRWGWISSSHILQKAFFDSLFAYPERPAVEALYASKAVLYYYTDLVYGLNYFGDPTLKVHTYVPARPEVTVSIGREGLNVKVQIDGNPASCNLVLAEEGTIIGEYTTDEAGAFTIDYPFESTGEYRLSTVPREGTISQLDFIPALVTNVEDEVDNLLPTEFALHQNYPNPFNPSTSIAFDLPQASSVRLTVFNILGQTVSTLIDEPMSSGHQTIEWQAVGTTGEHLASGIYFYRLETDLGVDTKKMILLK